MHRVGTLASVLGVVPRRVPLTRGSVTCSLELVRRDAAEEIPRALETYNRELVQVSEFLGYIGLTA